MRKTPLILAMGVALTWASVASAQAAASEDTLRATHELMVQAVKTGNVTMMANLVHPRGLGFLRDSQQLVELGPAVKALDIVPALIADVGRFTSTPFTTAFRVIGDVGVVAATSVQAPNPEAKDVKEPRYLRSTFMYVYSAEGWKLASWHTSETPLKKK